VRAVGWTPLAASLQRAQGLLSAASPGQQVVYVVSDGNETCGGDPIAIARAINAGNTGAIVNIIGFDLPRADRAGLGAVASAGGGALIDISDDASYQRMLAATREAMPRSNNTVRASNVRANNVTREPLSPKRPSAPETS
jgi:Ca-activated chloride channel family protein